MNFTVLHLFLEVGQIVSHLYKSISRDDRTSGHLQKYVHFLEVIEKRSHL
jgi:hypothetical protein